MLPEDKYKPLYNIKTASEMSGVGTNLIRAYERMGLLKPYREPRNNYRLFTLDEVEWIGRIKKLINEVGLNIEGIKCVLTIEPCWENRDCPPEKRHECPGYTNRNFPCWFSKMNVECCENEKCFQCEHYIVSRQHRKLRIDKKI